MNKACDLFELMLKLSEARDSSAIIDAFINRMSSIFQLNDFKYHKSKPEVIDEHIIEVAEGDRHFGFITFNREALNNPEDERIIKNAVKLFTSFLGKLQILETAKKEKESYKNLAEEHVRELNQTIAEVESSRSAAINLVEDVQIEMEKRAESEQQLRELKEDLENQVKQKTEELQKRIAELERFHQATIDREFRIKELRDELETLKNQAQKNV